MYTDIENVLMLNETSLKLIVPEISPDVHPDFLSRSILMEQKKTIRPLLGYDLYNELCLQISGNTLTTENRYLLENYIVIILSLSVAKRVVLKTSYQIENSGLRKKFSDSSELATSEEISYYNTALYQDDIDHFINEMIKYIKINQSLYPLFFLKTDQRKNSTDYNRQLYNFGFNISKI